MSVALIGAAGAGAAGEGDAGPIFMPGIAGPGFMVGGGGLGGFVAVGAGDNEGVAEAEGFGVMPGIGAIVFFGAGVGVGMPGIGAIVAAARAGAAEATVSAVASRKERANKTNLGRAASILRNVVRHSQDGGFVPAVALSSDGRPSTADRAGTRHG